MTSFQPHERLIAAAAANDARIERASDGTVTVTGAPSELLNARSAAELLGGSVMFNRATPHGVVYIVVHDDGAAATMVRVDDRDEHTLVQCSTVTGQARIGAILDELFRESIADELDAVARRAACLLDGVSLGGRHRLTTLVRKEFMRLLAIDSRDAR